MRFITLGTLFALSITAVVAAESYRFPFDPISFAEPASIILPKTTFRPSIEIGVAERHDRSCSWDGDCFVLTVKPLAADNRLIPASLPFESSYGGFRVFVTDLNGDGVEEIVTVTGKGRGTCAREEFLTIYRWDGKVLKPSPREMISQCFGSTASWEYVIRFERDPSSEQRFITLALSINEKEDGSFKSRDLIPTATKVSLAWNEKRHAFERSP